MRILTFIFVSLLIITNAQAFQCYLTEEKDQDGNYVLYKIKGGRPAPETICRVKCKEDTIGGDYDIKIVQRNAQGDIVNQRSWSEDATLNPNEQVECSINETKRQARLDQRKQEEQERQERREKIKKLRQDFKQECIEKFTEKRGSSKDFNICLSALFKKVFNEFDKLPEDALKFDEGNN